MCPSRPQAKQTMQMALTDAETLFEELLHDLSPETAPRAREVNACVRAQTVKPPAPL